MGKSMANIASIALFVATLLTRFTLSYTMNSLDERYRVELFKRAFGKNWSRIDNFERIYQCSGTMDAKEKCCSCDEKCHQRHDCCLRIDYKDGRPHKVLNRNRKVSRQFDSQGCRPVLPKHIQSNFSIEHVVALHRCLNGSQCVYENTSSTLVLGGSGKVYANAECALCNNETNFTYPEIMLSDCINDSLIEQLNGGANFEIDQLRKCHVTLKLPHKIVCPFGGNSNSDFIHRIKSKTKCNDLVLEKCLGFYGAVKDKTGNIYPNFMCMNCLPNPTAPIYSDCSALKEKNTKKPKLQMSLTIQSFSSRATFIDQNGYKNSLTVCSKGTFNLDIGRCEYVGVELSTVEESELERITRRVLQIRRILLIPCVCLSFVCISATIFTYVYFKELRHIPGKILIGICLTMLAYLILICLCLFHSHSFVCVGTFVHFVIIFKHLLLLILSYYLRKLQYAEPHNYVRHKYYVIIQSTMAVVFSVVFVIVCVSQNFIPYTGVNRFANKHRVKFDGNQRTRSRLPHNDKALSEDICLIASTEGRLFLYFVPISLFTFFSLTLSFLSYRRISWLRSKVKKDFRNVLDMLCSSYTATLKLVVFVFVSDSLGFVYTGGEDIKARLINACFECLFLVCTGLQGIFVFIFFVTNKHIFKIYKSKLAVILNTVDYCMKETGCGEQFGANLVNDNVSIIITNKKEKVTFAEVFDSHLINKSSSM